VISASATSDAEVDRVAITDALYRYASCMDRFDYDGVRSVLADDIVAQYGNNDVLNGIDEVLHYIDEFCVDCQMQHHFLSVYGVDVDGDHAKALVYHTSHQLFERAPRIVHVLVGRYHNEMRRTEDGWKISKLLLELCWGERRADPSGYLAQVGGRGPALGSEDGRSS
jgi:ketosteroid isomerase-like protein